MLVRSCFLNSPTFNSTVSLICHESFSTVPPITSVITVLEIFNSVWSKVNQIFSNKRICATLYYLSKAPLKGHLSYTRLPFYLILKMILNMRYFVISFIVSVCIGYLLKSRILEIYIFCKFLQKQGSLEQAKKKKKK